MMMKSLLLGSAAALTAFSGAQAADAIIAAEPEPMEYVRVCDAYGSGYFYIPGTETCLAISGYVRYNGSYDFDTEVYEGQFRSKLQLDVQNDSEFGTAYSMLAIEAASTNNDDMAINGDIGVNGYFGIGGLEVGLYDNQFDRFFGYGGYNVVYDGYYGDAANQYVSYKADLGSFKAVAAIDFLGTSNKAGYAVAASTAFGPTTAALGFAYDSAAEAYMVKGSVDGAIGIVNAKLMLAYADDANYYSFEPSRYGFQALASGQVAITETVNAYATAGYIQKPDDFAYVSGGLSWNVVQGFAAAAEVNYEYDYATSDSSTAATLRVQRSF